MSKLWCTNIEDDTIENKYWRQVIFTGNELQVVLMSVPPRQELGWEVHDDPNTDQFFRIEKGRGVLQVGRKEGRVEEECDLYDGVATVVRGGMWHNLINESSTQSLKMYVIYGPPHHHPKTIDKTHKDEKRRERKEKNN